MSNKYNIEFFQSANSNSNSGDNLNDAYKKGASIKGVISEVDIGSSVNSGANAGASNSENSLQNSSNLWDFIGLSNFTDIQKQCTYDCGFESLSCLEDCSNPEYLKTKNINYEHCKIGCLKNGLSCANSCMQNIHVTLPVTTKSLNSNQINTSLEEKCAEYLPNEVRGIHSDIDNLAPYDMRSWPKEGKYGWTLSDINRMKRNNYDAEDVIEVNMNHSLYPILSKNPILEFNYNK
jgi:hypothetical protein